MLYFSTALHWEARPLIEHYRLKRVEQQGSFEIFAAQDVALVVTGVGKISSAVGSTLLFSRFAPKPASVAVNIGVAGGSEERLVGEIFSIHRVMDQASGKAFLPDMLVRSPFLEATVETLDRPGTHPEQLSAIDHLADMEASGFFTSAFSFFQAEQILCIKIVSDALQRGVLNANKVSSLLAQAIPDVTGYISETVRALEQIDLPLPAADFEILEDLCQRYRFTAQQRQQVLRAATGYTLRTQQPVATVLPDDLPSPGTPDARKLSFQLLHKIFAHQFHEAPAR